LPDALGKPADRRFFYTLDAMRGAAALAVVIVHDPGFLSPLRMPSAYLAVDFFFLLSGFVIAHAYGSRLEAGLTWRQFMRDRVIRLYPVYLLGVIIGFFSALVALALGGGTLSSLHGVLVALATGLMFLPSPTMNEAPGLFPLNGPGWSLFFELIINGIYALLLPWFTTRRLIVLVACMALLPIGAALWFGNLDLGSAWPSFVGGFARVSFSFFAGVLLHRLHRRGFSASRLALLFPCLLTVLLAVDLTGPWRVLFDLGCVLLVFPALIIVSSRIEPGKRLVPACTWLGAVSFPIYALHFPLQELMRRVVRFTGVDPSDLAPWAGFVVVPVMMVACYMIVRMYDQPLQRHWRRRNGAATQRRKAVTV
jgi:peptidoglycan/LPS O-acetylase OafA/YrhL